MATTFEVLYLGTGPEIDTTEGNVLSENASALVGTSYGSPAEPLAYGAQQTLSPVDYSGGTTNMYDIDNTLSNDTFSIDGGPPQTFDGLAIYNATLTYTDGTPSATITAVVIQDTAGNLYLVPESSANADYATMTAAPIESISLDSIYPISSGRLVANRQDTDFLCYAAGTRILTDNGEMPVETLLPGHRVVTLDHGLQPILWVRSASQPLENLETEGRPVLVRAGAFGSGIPKSDLVVSPQHRILIGGQRQLCEVFKSEALSPAKALTGLRHIRQMNGKRHINWVHFACDRHEIVRANGCWSESLLLGQMAVKAMSASELWTVRARFGRCAPSAEPLNGPPARPLRRVGEVRRAIKRASTRPEPVWSF